MGQLGSGLRVVGRLGSRVWVSDSFQIFALTAGGDVLGGEGNCRAREMSGGEMSYTSPGLSIEHLMPFLARWVGSSQLNY